MGLKDGMASTLERLDELLPKLRSLLDDPEGN
jgi:hypothetical protein